MNWFGRIQFLVLLLAFGCSGGEDVGGFRKFSWVVSGNLVGKEYRFFVQARSEANKADIVEKDGFEGPNSWDGTSLILQGRSRGFDEQIGNPAFFRYVLKGKGNQSLVDGSVQALDERGVELATGSFSGRWTVIQ